MLSLLWLACVYISLAVLCLYFVELLRVVVVVFFSCFVVVVAVDVVIACSYTQNSVAWFTKHSTNISQYDSSHITRTDVESTFEVTFV